MADIASILKKQRENREREKQKEKQEQEAKARQERAKDEASEGNRYSYKPPKPPKPPVEDQESEGSRYSYKPPVREAQQEQAKKKKQVQEQESEGKRYSYTPPSRREEESEGNRHSYKPPEHDREADRRDERHDRERDARRPAPMLSYTPSPQLQRREPRVMYDTPRGGGLDDLSTGLPSARGGGMGYNGPQSDTVASGWRPSLGPQPRENLVERPGWHAPQAVEPGEIVRRPLDMVRSGVQAGNRAGDYLNRQIQSLDPTARPIAPMGGEQPHPPARLQFDYRGYQTPDVDTGTPGLSQAGTTGLSTTTSRTPTGADYLSSQGVDVSDPLKQLAGKPAWDLSKLWTPKDTHAQQGVGAAYADKREQRRKELEERRLPGGRFISTRQMGEETNALKTAFDLVLGEPGDRITALPVPGIGYAIADMWHAFTTAFLKTEGDPSKQPLFTMPKWKDSEDKLSFTNGRLGIEPGKPSDAVVHTPARDWDVFSTAFMEELSKSKDISNFIESLPPEQRATGSKLYWNLDSGPESMQKAADLLLNRDKYIADLEKKADESQAFWDKQMSGVPGPMAMMVSGVAAYNAAQNGRMISELKSMTDVEILQQNQDPWAEMLSGLIFDPTNLMGPVMHGLGLTPEAMQAARETKNIDRLAAMSAEEAGKYINTIMADAQPMITGLGEGTPLPGVANASNPFARTADTVAHQSANSLFRQALVLLNGVTDKATARSVLKMWAEHPEALLEGVEQGGNKLKFGLSALDSTAQNRAVLSLIADQIDQLPALQGEGAFKAADVAGGLDNLIYGSSRRAYGLDKLAEYPVGATKFVVKKNGKEMAVLQYLNKDGRLLGTSEQMTIFEANQKKSEFMQAGAAGGNPALNLLKGISGAQRAIMSDMWLNMRPGHWVRNALGGTAALMAQDTYTLDRTSDLMDYQNRKFGTTEFALGEEAEGRGSTAMTGAGQGNHWSRKWFGNNPLAQLSEAGGKVWQGNTTVPFTQGRVPFGETNFRLRSFTQIFKRFFEPRWKQAVTQAYVPKLMQYGVEEELAKSIAGHLVDSGLRGNKADVLATARSITSKSTIPVALTELGINPDTFTPAGWDKLDDILSSYVPGEEAEAQARLHELLEEQTDAYNKIAGETPVQPGRTVHTRRDVMEDGADIITQAGIDAQQAGADPEQAKALARQYVQDMIAKSKEQWDVFVREAAVGPNRGTMGVIMDTWKKTQDLAAEARKVVDAESLKAIKKDTRPAWEEKWRQSTNIYDKMFVDRAKIFDQARLDLASVDAARADADYWNALQRHIDYDERVVNADRQLGLGLGKPEDKTGEWEKSINAGRQVVDQSFTELMGVLRQFPSQDALDIVVAAQRHIDDIGAGTRGKVAVQRARMSAGEIGPQEFYKFRNQAWYSSFDNQGLANRVATHQVVVDALAKETATQLRWTDDFGGTKYQLLGPGGADKWLVRNLDTGETMAFNSKAPGPNATAAGPQVPQSVVNDYYRVVGNQNKIVEETISSITPQTVASTTEARAGNDYTYREGPLTPQELVGEDARVVYNDGDPTTTPTVGDVANYRRRLVEDGVQKISTNLASILTGQPNTLTEAQRLRAVDEAANLGAMFDNILDAATRVGQEAADFSMLNFRDRRNGDVLLSQIFPYHFYYTRSAKNWAWRIATKPSVANFIYETNRGIELENQQAGVPGHLEGTLPNPLSQYGIGPERMANPLNYGLPLSQYQGNDFVNPDDATNSIDYYARLIQKYTPGIYPALDIALKTARGDPMNLNVGEYVPMYRIGGYAYQAATGNVSDPNSYLGYGQPWDLGLVGKQIALAVMGGTADPTVAKYAMDRGYQIQRNVPALPEEPAAARMVWEAGAEKAGVNKLWAVAGAYLLGLGFYSLTPEEQKMRDMKQQRFGLGYSTDNPYGSRAAQKEFDQQYGGVLSPGYNYSNLYPDPKTYQPRDDVLRPGASAAMDQKSAEEDAIYAARQKARDEYLTVHPEATNKELKEATGEADFRAQLKALDTKYPSAAYPEGKGGVPKGMTPDEQAYWQLERIFKASKEGQPEYFAEGATDEEKQAYYDAYSAWEPGQLDAIERGINGLLALDETEFPGITRMKPALNHLAKGQYASELIRRYGLRFASDIERRWDDMDSLRSEVTDAEWDAREKRLQDHFTPEQYTWWKEYMKTEKDSDARRAAGKEHPVVYLMNALAYSPEKFEAVAGEFGPNWEKTYMNYPPWASKDATEAQKQASYAAEDAYVAKNPGADELKMYVDGRRRPAGLGDEYRGQGAYGEDYREATSIFGENIFEIDRNVPDYDKDKDAYFAYMKKYEKKLYGFWAWRKELFEMTPEEYKQHFSPNPEEGVGPTLENYTGPRPYGSDRQPLGLDGQPALYPSNRGISTEPLTDEMRASVVTGAGGAETPLDTEMPLPPTGSTGETAGVVGASSPVEPAGVDGTSATGKTLDDYLAGSESYQKHLAKQVKYQQTSAEWAGRRGNVTSAFGDEAGKTWDEYYKLPKGKARDNYRADHPELKLYTIAGFHPEEFAQAGKLFEPDDMLKWVNAPAWDGTEETDNLRSEYWAKNPAGFAVGAWFNGRPSSDNERDKDPLSEDWSYDFGGDFATAEDKFGEKIWATVMEYKTLYGDKAAQKEYRKAHPEYLDWSKWWYANLPDTDYVASSFDSYRSGPGYDSLGHRAYGSWGGGGYGGGGGGGSGDTYVPRLDPAYVQPRYMNSSLWNSAGEGINRWHPEWIGYQSINPELRGQGLKRTWA